VRAAIGEQGCKDAEVTVAEQLHQGFVSHVIANADTPVQLPTKASNNDHCKMHYNYGMSALTIRTDPSVERALDALTKDGKSRSEAARDAILAAEREQRRARMRAEAEALRNDPDDVEASKELAAEMEEIRAW
jgi:Arc/MetJ-type ribon-helix-helix transcriptional regulator